MLLIVSSRSLHSLLQRDNAFPNNELLVLLIVRAPALHSHTPITVTILPAVHSRVEQVVRYGYAESSVVVSGGTAID